MQFEFVIFKNLFFQKIWYTSGDVSAVDLVAIVPNFARRARRVRGVFDRVFCARGLDFFHGFPVSDICAARARRDGGVDRVSRFHKILSTSAAFRISGVV